MSTIAELTYNPYMVLVFDKYNERYEGSYPNLKYKANVRARFEARNGGSFSIQASNTLRLGGLSASYGMYYGYGTKVTNWYEVGTIDEGMGCSRSKSWEWGCSNSGFPNLSGTARTSSPTIPAPQVEGSIQNIQQNSVDINWKMSGDPYGIYRIWIKKPDGKWTNQLRKSNGTYTLEGLNPNTDYEISIEAWLADGTGTTVASKKLKFKTIENYPEIKIEDIQVEVSPKESTDNALFTVKTSDDIHVKSSTWQIVGGPSSTKSGLSYSETGLAQNSTMIISCSVTDTLNRTTSVFRKEFNTTYTQREVYIFNGVSWKKGYSMSILENLFKYCELWVFSRTRGWLRSPAYKYTYYPEVTQVPYVYEPSATDTTARISWSYVQNAYSYGIEIYETNNEENYNLYTTSNNSYTITDLTPNTMYSVKVIGVNEGGDPGIASNPITFSTTSADIGTDVVINTPVFTQDNYVNGSKIGTVSCQIHNADPSADVKIEIQRTGLTSTYYMGNSGSGLYKRSNLSFVSAYQYTVRVLYIKDGDTKYSNSITIN